MKRQNPQSQDRDEVEPAKQQKPEVTCKGMADIPGPITEDDEDN